MSQEEIYRLQQSLVDTLKKDGVLTAPQVEDAFLSVPRHLFLPGEPLERVYSDIVIMVKRSEEGYWTSSSSQPAIMAIMLEQLDLHLGQRVLEIGAGTGFNAALMAHIVGLEGQVTTIDIQPDLVEAARQHLDAAGYPWVQAVAADGGYGYPPGAPYDRIILTVSSAVIAPAWREQLVPGGLLLLPLNIGGSQISIAFKRRGDELVGVSLKDCGFMPLQGAFSAALPVRTQVRSEPRLSMISAQELPVPVETFAAWLEAAQQAERAVGDIASGVEVPVTGVWRMMTWLAVHQLPWAQLFSENEPAEPPTFPPLLYYGQGTEWRTRMNLMLVEPSGAAALIRRPGQPVPFEDWKDPGPPEPPFELYIRPIGPDPAPALRLLQIIQDWERAGKPTTARMRFRAIPADAPYQPAEGELILERPWTNLIVWFE